MSASVGTFGRLGIGATSTVDKRLNYRDETFVGETEAIDGNGIRGTRDSSVELFRNGNIHVNGPLNLIPTTLELSYILEWIMGGSPSGSGTVTYPLGESAETRFVVIDRIIQVFTYAGVAVDRAEFRASEGGLLTVALGLVGQTEIAGNAGTFPAISLDVSTQPLIFTDTTLSINSTTVKAKDFRITIDNMIDKERFLNQTTLSAVNALDRRVGFECTIPYGDYSAIYTALTGGSPGLAVTVTLTNAGASLVFTMPAVSLPKRTPGTPGRRELMLGLSGRALKLATTPSLSTVLTVGP